ncbi:MAG: hypothetical protein PVF49_05775 [Anaerolineales bacterium]
MPLTSKQRRLKRRQRRVRKLRKLRRKLEETTDTKRRRELIAKMHKVSPSAEVPEK